GRGGVGRVARRPRRAGSRARDCVGAVRAGLMPLVGFYGDDFTGSVDALLQLRRSGLDGVILTRPDVSLPSDEPVVGIAGTAPSLPTDAMADEVRPALTCLRDLDPVVVQSKACSTADSAAHTGSLGRALEVGQDL